MEEIYVLELENNKYYIGKTNNLQERYQQHLDGIGSKWTKKYKPLNIILKKKKESLFEEDNLVLQYIISYGIENVRGGTFSNLELNNEQIKTIKNLISTALNTCFICNMAGHFAKKCPYKYEQSIDCYKIITDLNNKKYNLNYNRFNNWLKKIKPNCWLKLNIFNKLLLCDSNNQIDVFKYHITKKEIYNFITEIENNNIITQNNYKYGQLIESKCVLYGIHKRDIIDMQKYKFHITNNKHFLIKEYDNNDVYYKEIYCTINNNFYEFYSNYSIEEIKNKLGIKNIFIKKNSERIFDLIYISGYNYLIQDNYIIQRVNNNKDCIIKKKYYEEIEKIIIKNEELNIDWEKY